MFVLLRIPYGSFVSKNGILKPLKHVERLKSESQGMNLKIFRMKRTKNSCSPTDFMCISFVGVASTHWELGSSDSGWISWTTCTTCWGVG